MNVDEVVKNDIEELQNLAQRAIVESVDANDSIKNEIVADTMIHIENNVCDPDCVFLKCFGENILGFILIQRYWNLSDLFVLPEVQGQGVGKLLLDAAISACLPKQDKGYIRVNSSLNAEGFYRRLGFECFTPEKEGPIFVVPLKYKF